MPRALRHRARPRRSTSARSRSPRPPTPSTARARASTQRPTSSAKRRRAAPERPVRAPARSATGCSAARSPATSAPDDDRRDAEGLRACAAWAAPGFPTGQKWEIVAAQEPTPKYAICNADESEPGTFKDRQILAEQPHLVLEGMLLGMLVTGSRGGLGLHPPRVRPRGGGAARRDRGAARGGPARRRRARHRPAAAARDLHLARRLHPRRGVGAARVHGGPPRRAAQQAAVPRPLRPLGQADADELRRDVRRRPDHPRARRRLVEGAGRQRRDGAEVLRRLRPRRAAGRLLRAGRLDDARPDRARRRRDRAAARSAPSSPAARRRTSSARSTSTCRSTGSRCRRPARCSARAR